MSKPSTPAPGKTARNEQRKLRAATFNAIGLAFAAFGVIQPVVLGQFTLEVYAKLAMCAVIAYILHRRATNLLAALED